jgi:hypothetical protein
MFIAVSHISANETICKNDQNLELKNDDSIPPSDGVKVEIVDLRNQ